MNDVSPAELRSLLDRIHGPRIAPNDAENAASEMRKLGPEVLFPLLAELLADPDPETRCLATLGVFVTDQARAAELLIPMLNDSDHVVRWHTCGLMHDLGDPRCVDGLVAVMKTDQVPHVRNTAAYALGGIGDPRAIPALIETMESDHEFDDMGYNASSNAATALNDIVGSQSTRIKHANGLCQAARESTDRDALKALAMAYYHSVGQSRDHDGL